MEASVNLAGKLLHLAQRVVGFGADLEQANAEKRRRIGAYCTRIAETLRGLGAGYRRALADDGTADWDTISGHYGRLRGYLDDLPDLLAPHLDGRKVHGLRRRLESLVPEERAALAAQTVTEPRVSAYFEAAGAFEALADRLSL